MSGIKEYILGVITAAILCAIVSQLVKRDSFIGTAVKLISSVFMLISLVSPVMNIKFKPEKFLTDFTRDANHITTSAVDSSRESIARIIKERTQAYILDKANLRGAALTIEVALSDDDIQKPVSVTLSGEISPYAKKLLSEAIEKDLGISAEAQIWN